MTSIGQTLKDARSKKSITLEDVHARIKIHPRVLQLLEEDKFDKLPSPLFAKSFLKSYAEFLELNPEELLSVYEKEIRKDPEQQLFIKPAGQRIQHQPFDRNWVVVPLAVLTALAALFLLFQAFKFAAKSVSGMHWPKHRVTAKPVKEIATSTVEVKTQAEGPKESEGTAVEWIRTREKGDYPDIPRRRDLELKILALDNVWLKITCDDKVLFQAILKKGASENWRAKDKIEIWTGNSSNMALTLNRKFLGSPGKGVVKKLVLTREGAKIVS